MRALWEQEQPSFQGEFVNFSGVNAHPRPVQNPLPVVMGGHSAAAHRRTARHASGWYGFFLDLDAAAEQLDSLRRSLAEVDRDLTGFEVTVTPRGRIDAEAVAAYGRLGVDRLVLRPRGGNTIEEVEAFVRAHAPERLAATSLAA
jgi:alkanesulfonate monooxygenase SsuD/methylene tetrahydromethanopterin reductase-like flavin-dependent oxidoreductase (luciferase family)